MPGRHALSTLNKMHRLFVGLAIPEIVADALSVVQSGVDGANWRPPENFHITLAFIGETDRHGFSEALEALASIEGPSLDVTLSGFGYFGDRQPRAIWAGLPPNEALILLQSKVARALRQAGFSLEKRKYTPHVTVAYTKHALQADVERYCARHGLFSCGLFPVDAFHLYASHLGGEGSHYEIEASYALSSSK